MSRVIGFLKGRLNVPADFDAPMPDEVLLAFEGAASKASTLTVATLTQRLGQVRRPALEVAAQSASTSYRTNLPPEVLSEALRTGAMPANFAPHIGTLLDEAPISMLAKVVEQIHADGGMPQELVWSNVRGLARSLKLARDLSVQALLKDMQAIDAADVAAGRRTARSLWAVQPGDLKGYTFTPSPTSEYDKPGEGW